MPTWTSEAADSRAASRTDRVPDAIRQEIAARAAAEGFEAFGVTRPEALGAAGDRFRSFLALGRHGRMDWLAAKADWRAAPRAMWPQVRSIVMVGANYGPAEDPLARLQHSEQAAISVYAQGDDYHDVLKKRLKRLGRWMAGRFDCDLKVFVDTAAVLEKPLAAAAGIGWQGKHTNLVSRRFGSWLFLGALYTDLDLPPDESHRDACGSCRRCLEVCPTDAFPAPYQLDARACLSYLTIEQDGPIPRRYRRAMGNRIYGCDDCLAVCPWNRFAQQASEAALQARTALHAPRLTELATLDDAGFRALFRKTAVKRIGRDRFVRNVAVALGNMRADSADRPAAIAALRRLLDDAAAPVRAMAVWALAEHLGAAGMAAEAAVRARDPEPMVRAEWADALGDTHSLGGATSTC
ncbi:tRNA epoxyqueuosine(34) reductase QueG [Marinibaculum pumilum]|uniref:Epoxyqueuosine reductase n=1 Tax=Marinibaculum pumilum TaxID=1766165 RepID=A0ABV7L762_9PROT